MRTATPPAAAPARRMNTEEARAEARRLAALASPGTMGCYALERFAPRAHVRHIADAVAGMTTDDRVMVFTPPQVGKSTLVSELTSLWWLAYHPDTRIGIASYAASLALRKSRSVRELVRETGVSFGLELKTGETSMYDWSITKGGGVRGVGVGGSLTGFPITGIGILDDPHKDRKSVSSKRQRDAVWDWYSSVWLTRFAPGVPMLIACTRWHIDDLPGRLLAHEGRLEEGGAWRVISLPAFAGEDDPLGREPGQPLTHPAIPDHDVDALRAYWEGRRRATPQPRDWAALYQCTPIPGEGNLLSREVLVRQRRFDGRDAATPVRRAVSVDPSGGGRDTAGIMAGYLGADRRLYLTHDRSAVMPVEQWTREACLLARTTKADVILVESNFGADLATRAVRTAWTALQLEGAIPTAALPPRIKAVRVKTGKYLRAEPIAQQYHEDRIRSLAYMPELEAQWETWDPNQPDSPGSLDACVILAFALLPVPGAAAHVSSPASVSLGEAARTSGGLGSIPLRRTPPPTGRAR